MLENDKDKELIIRLDEQLKALKESQLVINTSLISLQKDVTEMKGLAKQWKGGFLLILMIGGFLSWVATIAYKWI